MRKKVEDIRPEDFAQFPVWEFVLDEEAESDTLLTPVCALPADHLNGRVVGTAVRLANATMMSAMLCNIDIADPKRTQHFISLAIFDRQAWRHLARYHDADFASNGPEALAAALNLTVSEVFPIAYDLRSTCNGNALCLTGAIAVAPSEILPPGEIIALAVD
jgi:hypothetical protein